MEKIKEESINIRVERRPNKKKNIEYKSKSLTVHGVRNIFDLHKKLCKFIKELGYKCSYIKKD
jgi:hypothetical protein